MPVLSQNGRGLAKSKTCRLLFPPKQREDCKQEMGSTGERAMGEWACQNKAKWRAPENKYLTEYGVQERQQMRKARPSNSTVNSKGKWHCGRSTATKRHWSRKEEVKRPLEREPSRFARQQRRWVQGRVDNSWCAQSRLRYLTRFSGHFRGEGRDLPCEGSEGPDGRAQGRLLSHWFRGAHILFVSSSDSPFSHSLNTSAPRYSCLLRRPRV